VKIALSSSGKDVNSKLSDVFGRCPYFLIVEIDNKKIKGVEAIENTSINQMGGAGISAAQKVVEKGATAVITRNVGPRALEVLKQFNIQVFSGTGSVKKVTQKFVEGKLEKINYEAKNERSHF
jgi:predicted Fe-Mo cluster-binding NifX family protein